MSLLILIALVAFLVGFFAGEWSANTGWLIRSKGPYQTPHHCRGGFYYVIPESEFVRGYRPVIDPDSEEESCSAPQA